MGVIGYKTLTVTASSTASYTLPTYINFYLMLDVSGSMSFPSTSSEQQDPMAVNPDNLTGSIGYSGGCQFACISPRRVLASKQAFQDGMWDKDLFLRWVRRLTRPLADIAKALLFRA